MNDHQLESELKTFRVTVGHKTVTVQCRTNEEVVEIARRQLCLELPRMWDVIHALGDDRFEISRAA